MTKTDGMGGRWTWQVGNTHNKGHPRAPTELGSPSPRPQKLLVHDALEGDADTRRKLSEQPGGELPTELGGTGESGTPQHPPVAPTGGRRAELGGHGRVKDPP